MLSEAVLHANLETVFRSKQIADKIIQLGKAENEAFTKEKEGSEEYEKQSFIKISDTNAIENEVFVENWDFQSGDSYKITNGDSIDLVIGKKHLKTKVIGIGAYGTILHSVVNNAVYKLLKLETKIKDDDTIIFPKYAFQNICKEIAIQNIISHIDYVNDSGEKQKCASPILAIYRFNNAQGKTSDIGLNQHTNSKGEEIYSQTQMILLEMNPMSEIKEPIVFDRFVYIFKSFLQILQSIRKNNIYFSHCDVKLNNMMYNADGNLRLIDFGFSSIYFKLQKTNKTVEDFMLLSPNDECKWVKEKNYDYPEKDVLQFLLSSSLFDLDIESRSFREYVLNLFDHPENPYLTTISTKVLKMLNEGDERPEFNLGYNFKLGLRRRLRKHMKQAFHMYSPEWILTNFDTVIQSFKDIQYPNINVNKRTKVPYINVKNATVKNNNKNKNKNKNATRKGNNK
jgi:molybdopterin converting factor small subunit